MNHAPASRGIAIAATAFVLAIVAAVYWPVLDAGFVWDDFLTFEQRAWLYDGDAWKHYIFNGFNEWSHYFRPLVVGLFVLQVRLFDGAPEPMHAVSLVMHLVNVGLVMAMARSLPPAQWPWRSRLALLSGLCYGLHPMLVESVTWIGCQFDQMQVMAGLGALLCARYIDDLRLRAPVLAILFLLSAGAKESAATLPAIVFLFDWLHRSNHGLSAFARAMDLLRRNWPAYAALVLAGIFYLWLRRTMMGTTLTGFQPEMLIPNAARLDQMAYVYLKYWAVVTGVPTELNPLHAVGSVKFGVDTGVMLGRAIGALAIFSLSLLVLSRRFPTVGVLVLAVSLYLVPVLGFLPIEFDNSIYHERYAIGAIVLACVLMPTIVHEMMPFAPRLSKLKVVFLALPVLWLAWAVTNVRATIPLWSNNVALWEWALQGNPGNKDAMGNLVSAYIIADQDDKAAQVVNDALAQDLDCPNCYLNGFMLAVRVGDREMIEATIPRIRDSAELMSNAGLRYSYLRTVGLLELRENNPEGAIAALTAAIEIEQSESSSQLLMAEALMATGKPKEAEIAAEHAVRLAHPAEATEVGARAKRVLAGERVNRIPLAGGDPSVVN